MSDSFYSQLASVASRILTDKGKSLTFTRVSGGTFDPVAGETTGDSTTNYTGYGAAFNYNKSEIDGTIVQNGDIRLLLEDTATAPILEDTVTIDSIIYTVKNVTPTSPAGVVVMYELQLRR